MKRSHLYGSLVLAVLGLTGCQDKRQVTAVEIQCRERLPAPENESVSSQPADGMSYLGFQIGESAHLTESRIAQHKDWIEEERSDCDGVWYMGAGTTLRDDHQAVCDVHGETECELVRVAMERTNAGIHVLTDLMHVQRFERQGRPTQAVLAELRANYGEPVWERALRRSPGWPNLVEETSFIWATRREGVSDRRVVANFEEEAIRRLGAGDYLIVTLIHNDDHTVTYAVTAKLRRWSTVGS